MISEIKNISSKTYKHWRSVLLIYIVQLLLGIFVAVLAYSKINNGLGASLELDRLARGFDRSVFSDMMNRSPEIISAIQDRFTIAAIVFLVVSIFLHAGLLGNIKREEYSMASFFKNGKKYFIRFAGIASIAILKMSFVLALIWIPFIKCIGDPLQSFHSDKTFILTTLGLVVFNVLLIIVIWIWSVLTRYSVIDGNGFVMAMKTAWQQLKSRFATYFSMGLIVVFFHIVLTWLYTFIVDDWGAATWFCVLGLIFIQQLFSGIRIWLRVLAYTLLNSKI